MFFHIFEGKNSSHLTAMHVAYPILGKMATERGFRLIMTGKCGRM